MSALYLVVILSTFAGSPASKDRGKKKRDSRRNAGNTMSRAMGSSGGERAREITWL